MMGHPVGPAQKTDNLEAILEKILHQECLRKWSLKERNYSERGTRGLCILYLLSILLLLMGTYQAGDDMPHSILGVEK